MAGLKVGRKRMRPEDKKVNVTLSISPLGREVMNRLIDNGYMISREFDRFLLQLGRKEKIISAKGKLIDVPVEEEPLFEE